MLKLISVVLLTALLAGSFLFPASAMTEEERIRALVEALGVPDPMPSQYGTLKARFDRGQLVFGFPDQVPDNDWKKAATSWEGENREAIQKHHPDYGFNHSGQEPRYLGFTAQGDLFSNDWFPIDAPSQIAPAKRNMIANPWEQKSNGERLCKGNSDSISDYTWTVILAGLFEYHKTIGFDSASDGFAFNPAFKGKFDIDTINNYFKVLSEPQPGIAGAVRHWHYRGGVPYYDTITIGWEILPDFSIEKIEPGTDKARPGEVYHGKVVLRCAPSDQFLYNPMTEELYQIIYGSEVRLSKKYTVPIGVAAGGRLAPMNARETPIPGVYVLEQVGEGEYVVNFTWQLPSGWDQPEITLASEVNDYTNGVLPLEGMYSWFVWDYPGDNNYKAVKVPVDVKDLAVTGLKIAPNPAQEGDTVTVSARVENSYSQDIATKVQYRFHGGTVGEQEITVPASGSVPVSFTVTWMKEIWLNVDAPPNAWKNSLVHEIGHRYDYYCEEQTGLKASRCLYEDYYNSNAAKDYFNALLWFENPVEWFAEALKILYGYPGLKGYRDTDEIFEKRQTGAKAQIMRGVEFISKNLGAATNTVTITQDIL